MGRLFGTDGARGVANTELTCELAMAIGRAAALTLAQDVHRRPRIVIGKDTRISSDMLEAALSAGLCSVGADALLLGVVPTPAVAYLVSFYKADAGIMISASHNSCEYNGIKLFNQDGYKLSDAIEEQIEALVLDHGDPFPHPVGGEIGRMTWCKNAAEDYVRHLLSTTQTSLRGMKLAVDCANGSASATAKRLFDALEADCVFLSDQPDGTNINEDCGSTHIDRLAAFVKEHKCFAGVAFDGDADRCLAVDEQGTPIDGDKIIAILAGDLQDKKRLKNNTAVVTVMTNLGFFRCCEERGISVSATAVGDRYVLEEMLKNGYVLGGEQSGHIILLDYATTGDGQLSAIQLLAICRERGQKLSRVAAMMQRFPQVILNIKADAVQKQQFQADTALQKAIEEVNQGFGRDGRVLVRVSGTEPLIRIMVEGKDFDDINRVAVDLGEQIKLAIGSDV